MSIQDSDKLLVGRDNTSFQIPFSQSGIALNSDLVTSLGELTDVTLNTPSEGQALTFTPGTGGAEGTWSASSALLFNQGYGNTVNVLSSDTWVYTNGNKLFLQNKVDNTDTLVVLNGAGAAALVVKSTGEVNLGGSDGYAFMASEESHAVTKKYLDEGYDPTIKQYVDALEDRIVLKTGDTMTGSLNFTANTDVNLIGNNTGVNLKAGYWGALKYDGNLQLEWGKTGIKMGRDINMKAGNVGLSDPYAEDQYNNDSIDEHLRAHAIHWLKAPEHKYDATNKQYVDDAIANLGDFLTFKGTIDFTTDAAPASPAVGDVYVNTGTGAADASWGLTGDVAPGEMYGRGESQWGMIGSSQVDLTGYATETYVDDSVNQKLNKAGDTVSTTEDVSFTYNRGVNFESYGNLYLYGDRIAELEGEDGVKIVSGEDNDIILDPRYGLGKIRLQGQTIISRGPLRLSNSKIHDVGTPTAASDATTKQYVDDNDSAVKVLSGAPSSTKVGDMWFNTSTNTLVVRTA